MEPELQEPGSRSHCMLYSLILTLERHAHLKGKNTKPRDYKTV